MPAYSVERQGRVVVEGVESDPFQIFNTVFQGTVLGPPLWNLFFADVVVPAEMEDEKIAIFADDLNVFKLFDTPAPSESLLDHMEQCRTRVHKWGETNRVALDAGKEHIVILHPTLGEGESFKLLGCLVDCKLQMHDAVDKILAQARPKVNAILRLRQHYEIKELINQFKTHIWSILEIHNGATFHAVTGELSRLDALQKHFLKELNVEEDTAFLEYNFAPPVLRRDIGILGLLHKRVLGKAHPVFQELLPFHNDVFGSLREGVGEHTKQLYGRELEVHKQFALYDRSIFVMVYKYNKLPQEVVDTKDVSTFQKMLTNMARRCCENGDENWQLLFHSRRR